MRKFLLFSVIALLLGASTETFAQRRYNNNDRQRIRRGVRSGQLTRAEARQLRERERQQRMARRGYRSDGTLTREERRAIRRDERMQDRQIRSYRRNDARNDRRRGNGYYRRGAGSERHPVFGRNGRRSRW